MQYFNGTLHVSDGLDSFKVLAEAKSNSYSLKEQLPWCFYLCTPVQ